MIIIDAYIKLYGRYDEERRLKIKYVKVFSLQIDMIYPSSDETGEIPIPLYVLRPGDFGYDVYFLLWFSSLEAINADLIIFQLSPILSKILSMGMVK